MSELYLGLGRVMLAHEQTVRVRLEDIWGTTVTPEWALPFRYQAVAGDLLRVYGQAGRYYVVALVHTKGRAALSAPGDVSLGAREGRLRLSARSRLQLESPRLTLRASTLTSAAQSAREQLGRATRWAKQKLDVRAGGRHLVVDEDDQRIAKRSTNLAEQVVKIDGSLLQIGH